MSRTLAGGWLWLVWQFGGLPVFGRYNAVGVAVRWRAVSALIVFLNLGSPALLAATLSVPADYPTIQAAINSASSGDLVEVDIGTYRENIILRDDVDVQAIEAARTFLIAQDDTLPVVEAANVNNVLFAGFTISGSTDGVFIASSGISLANNILDSLSGTAVIVDIAMLSEVEILNHVFCNAQPLQGYAGYHQPKWHLAEKYHNIFSRSYILIQLFHCYGFLHQQLEPCYT